MIVGPMQNRDRNKIDIITSIWILIMVTSKTIGNPMVGKNWLKLFKQYLYLLLQFGLIEYIQDQRT